MLPGIHASMSRFPVTLILIDFHVCSLSKLDFFCLELTQEQRLLRSFQNPNFDAD